MWKLSFATVLLTLIGASAQAQNTGGVFGPVVRLGHSAVQYRLALDLDTDTFAQRLHYEQAVNGDFMLRGVVQTRETVDAEFDFDYVQAELFWHLTPDDQAWQTGVRFDFRVRDGDRPEIFGLNWMNQFSLAPRWSARFLVLSAIEIGDRARDGVFLQTRGNLFYRLESGVGVGVELFNSYGSTSNFLDFEDQSHQVGPFATIPVAKTWSLFFGFLSGLTEASPDHQPKFWATVRF